MKYKPEEDLRCLLVIYLDFLQLTVDFFRLVKV